MEQPLPRFIVPGALLTVLGIAGAGWLVGAVDVGGGLFRQTAAGTLLLVGSFIFACLALRSEKSSLLNAAGPGLSVATLVLALTYLAGLYGAAPQLEYHRGEITLLAGLCVACFAIGGLVTASILPRQKLVVPVGSHELRRSNYFRVVFIFAVFASGLNLATGDVPLLAANINAVRFAKTNGGVLDNLLNWVNAGLEWSTVASLVLAFWFAKGRRLALLYAAVSVIPLLLLAGRSFMVIIVLAVGVVVVGSSRIKLWQVAVTILVGIVVLGAAGQYRNNAGEIPLQKTGIQEQIFQSSGIGLSVFASVLDEVPRVIPYQHGGFILRDLRAGLPLHPFGRPSTGDVWVTTKIRFRQAAVVGGSPPTLAGGLFIDFGTVGVAVGGLLLGSLVALLYHWSVRARTLGSLMAYSYFAAYLALSAYSYVSLKPTMLIFMGLSYVLHWLERRQTHQPAVPA